MPSSRGASRPLCHLCLLHWQVDSLLLYHLRSPYKMLSRDKLLEEFPGPLYTFSATTCESNYFERKVKSEKTPLEPHNPNHLRSNHFHTPRVCELALCCFSRWPGTGPPRPALFSNKGSSGTNAKPVHFQSDQEEHTPVYLALGRVHGYFAKSHSQSHSHETETGFPKQDPTGLKGKLKAGLVLKCLPNPWCLWKEDESKSMWAHVYTQLSPRSQK